MHVTTKFALPVPCAGSWWSIAAGAGALARGELIVLHHEDRIVLVGCADTATPEQMAFLARHSAGRVEVVLHDRECHQLALSARPDVQSATGDSSSSVPTGTSCGHGAPTRVLAGGRSARCDLTRGGSPAPVRVNPCVFDHRVTAAAVALALTDAAVPRSSGAVVANLHDTGGPTGVVGNDDAQTFANRHGFTLIAVPPEFRGIGSGIQGR